ncbi:MAG: DUF1761 domain-containing protein [Micropruina sp.]|nr:MAG: DUF1761 domain-containing protein [Micropruina sp.]
MTFEVSKALGQQVLRHPDQPGRQLVEASWAGEQFADDEQVPTIAIGVGATAAGIRSVWLALLVGLGAWLAFSATTLLQHNAFEQKPRELTAINAGYQLALFLAMSLVLGLF